MEDVIDQCKAAILPKTVDEGFTFECYFEPIINKRIKGDPIRLRQVLMNLLSNATKFTSTGSVTLDARIKEINEKQVTVAFVIKDTGIGMNPEQISYVFDPYMQADDSVTRRFGGTGLGLPISKSIVELMGGKLSVESMLEVGSTFSFDLTFDLVDATSDTYINILSVTEKPSFNAEVLVCEDNPLNQQVISSHLSRIGIEAVVAQNGQEGVDIVRERTRRKMKPFDLIFMDIHMPVMDGLEAAKLISELNTDTPIVALTANIMEGDVDLYKDSGMLDLLGKPFTSQQLWKCLLKYLPVVEYTTENVNEQKEEEDRVLKQLQAYFAKSNRTTMDKITKALDDGDLILAHRLVHTLKGSAGQLGEKQLEKEAAAAEATLSDGKTTLTSGQINSLKSTLDTVLDNLTPISEIDDSATPEPLTDKNKIREIITVLEPILKQHSTECMNMLDDIRLIPSSENLVNYVEEFEFNKAVAEISRLKEKLNIKE